MHETIEEFPASLINRRISGVLIDSYIASEYQNTLSQFRLQAIIEHVSSNGIVFQNHGLKYDKCIRDYILSRQGDIYRQISKRIKPIKVKKIVFILFHFHRVLCLCACVCVVCVCMCMCMCVYACACVCM